MKKNILTALLILGLCFSVNLAANAEQSSNDGKIKEVYVNLDTVWRNSPQGKQDLSEIEQLVNATKEEVQKLRDDLQKMGEEFKAAVSQPEKEEKAKQIEQKRRELIEITTLKNREIEMKRNQAQQEFVETIIPMINDYRSTNGYMVIHRYTANDIVSIDPKVDITEEILEMYSKK
ncbi:MAG: OmpH family outer membrane protein [Cyanobacteriota bacterium]